MGLDDRVPAPNPADVRKDRVYADVNPSEARNENLEGGKSTRSSVEEAKQEKRVAPKADDATSERKDPAEIKASKAILPEDAQKKTEHSSGDEIL